MHSIASAFSLQSGIHFLNHGSFGACPSRVLDQQTEFRRQLEAEPVQFMVHALPPLWDLARQRLAQMLNASPAGLALLTNATAGVNAVLRSLPFRSGDEILVTNHGYNACSNAARFVAERVGAKVVVAEVPFPLASQDEIVDAVLAAVSEKTRLVLIDHVTSPTAIVMPVATIADALARRQIDLLVDGAHAPGMLPLDLAELDVPYYAGNCHKWLCAPKGCGFLHVRADRRADIHPTVISHGFNALTDEKSRFHLEFDWTGTSDPTAALCIPAAVETVPTLVAGSWENVMSHNHALAVAGRDLVCAALSIEPPTPEDMLGSIVSIPLPPAPPEVQVGPFDSDPLQRDLYKKHKIEIPIFPFPKSPQRMLRLSAHVYNDISDYEHLSVAIAELLAGTTHR